MDKSFHIIFMLLFLLGSCKFSSPDKQNTNTILVTDFRGKEISFSKPVKKVVCLIESALSGIYMLQQEEKLIGIPSNVYRNDLYNYYSRLDERIKNKDLPTPGSWDFINIEQIVESNPDLVIIWASQTEAIENIERFGIPVYAVMIKNFDDVYKEITDFGKLMDCPERAEHLIKITKNNLKEIHNKYSNSDPRKVYFMWAQGITETSGMKSTVNELLQVSGTENACVLKPEHVSVSVEKLYDWNPDLIVMWYNEKLDPDDIINNDLLRGLDAVKKRNVYELPEVFTCDFWTLKMIYPAELIANWAYPEKTKTCQDAEDELKNMFLNLYGKTL